MSVASVLEQLRVDPKFRERIAHIEKLPPREAQYGVLPRPLPEELSAYLEAKHIRLYRHQCQAIEAIRRREHLILTTATASGKTMAFNLPVFERLIGERKATALYLYPTKALSHDQRKAMRGLERFTGLDTGAAVYDGDTSTHRRPEIRSHSRIILSNPYELHFILPWHYKWSSFLQNLQFVIIDEAHRYRGIFGSHIAYLLRRLRRICALYGAFPQFILASATLANPEEFSLRLTGVPCTLIADDASPRGEKHFVLYNPYFDGKGERSVHQETKEVFLSCIKGDLQTLCFTGSRRLTELIAQWSREEFKPVLPSWVDQITAYRAGYLPEERRAIENRLKEGTVRGVVSTNALELGVDIGSLDAVVISGFPGTLISTWQQAGRAGRGLQESLAVLVGFQNPLDQYFMHHPSTFFSGSMEHAIVDQANPYITTGHLLCAAAELPLHPERDRAFLGDGVSMLPALQDCHLVRETSRGWVYAGKGKAVDAVPLGGISTDTFRVVCDGKILETMDRSQAFREGHQGAVILHGGETYLVQELDLETKVVRVKAAEVDYYTESIRSTDLTIIGEEKQFYFSDFSLRFGEVEVVEQYIAYRLVRRNAVIANAPLDLPALRFRTRALWFAVPDRMIRKMEENGGKVDGGLHGAEHILIGVMPFFVMCDRWDLGGLSIPCHPSTGAPMIFIYDGCEGGIGLAEKACELMDLILDTACSLVRDCPCEEGCPACIYSPKCGNDNRPLDKRSARILLEELFATIKKGQHTTTTECTLPVVKIEP
ncbi:MAG: DEAD/DEAH box helicase [Methanomicrobiales archaeon]|nr:DEAD/DEAH box helicase [Methanomicrobiales archaeon]